MKVNAIIKRIITLTLTLILHLVLPTTAVFALQPISVTIDGERVNFIGQQPAIIDGRTLVPVRGVFEQLGFEVDWSDELQSVFMVGSAHHIVIGINRAEFRVNLNHFTLDVPAQIINGSTMLPIRAVIEAVGYNLAWDGITQTVQITRPPKQDEPSAVQVGINVTVDGQPVIFGNPAQVSYDEGILTAPVRAVMEKLNFTTNFPLGYTRFFRFGDEILFSDSSNILIHNGNIHHLAKEWDRSVSYIAINPILEILGYELTWDSSTKTVDINSPPVDPIIITRSGETVVRADETGVHILARVHLTQEEIQNILPLARTQQQTRMSSHPDRPMTQQELAAWNQEYDDLGGMNNVELDALYLLNNIRREHNLPLFSLCPYLSRASRLHTNLQADFNATTWANRHQDPFYGRVMDRVNLFFNPRDFGTLRSMGENSGSSVIRAELGVNGWMRSPGHRTNILRDGAQDYYIGLGFTYRGGGTTKFIDQ